MELLTWYKDVFLQSYFLGRDVKSEVAKVGFSEEDIETEDYLLHAVVEMNKGLNEFGLETYDLDNLAPTLLGVYDCQQQKYKSEGEKHMAKVLVSACLLGENCKYNGGNNYNSAVAAFVEDREVLSICPEMMAGMGCPRTPIEIVDGVQIDRDGKNVDAPIREAVARIMEQIRQEEIECAVLQSRSPTCGVNQIYDGSFTGRLISGSGVFAKSLKDAGYRVIDAEDISKEAE